MIIGIRKPNPTLANCRPGSREVPHLLIKWRGYPLKDATWEPRSALMLRCSDMVRAFEETRGRKIAPEPTTIDSTANPPGPIGEEEGTTEVSMPPVTNQERPPEMSKSAPKQVSTRSSRLALQPKKSYDETKRRPTIAAAL